MGTLEASCGAVTTFFATLSVELEPATASEDGRKLFHEQMLGRRWLDRYEHTPLPQGTYWIQRTAGEGELAKEVHGACERDVEKAADAVRAMGREIAVSRVWIHVSGGGVMKPGQTRTS